MSISDGNFKSFDMKRQIEFLNIISDRSMLHGTFHIVRQHDHNQVVRSHLLYKAVTK